MNDQTCLKINGVINASPFYPKKVSLFHDFNRQKCETHRFAGAFGKKAFLLPHGPVCSTHPRLGGPLPPPSVRPSEAQANRLATPPRLCTCPAPTTKLPTPHRERKKLLKKISRIIPIRLRLGHSVPKPTPTRSAFLNPPTRNEFFPFVSTTAPHQHDADGIFVVFVLARGGRHATLFERGKGGFRSARRRKDAAAPVPRRIWMIEARRRG